MIKDSCGVKAGGEVSMTSFLETLRIICSMLFYEGCREMFGESESVDT